MRALLCKEYGPPDSLVIADLDDPAPGPTEVLVDVSAAGLNFPDLLIIAGKYQDKTPPPFVPGNEAAGTVSATGADVAGIEPGDKVVIMPRGGAFAEKCVVDQSRVAPIPPALDFEQAAAFGVVYGTSLHALEQCAHLQAGETLLVLGAAGGVGSAAVEIAKAMGASVIAAASSDEKLDYAREAGADHTINYTSDNLRDAIRSLTDSRGVDVVYDPVGGELAQQALRGLGWHGRYLVVGFASGEIPSFPANIALLKEASIIGVWWGTWLAKHPQEHRENLRRLAEWFADETLVPRVTESWAFEDYEQAFARIAGRKARGKVVLRLSD